jgi:hypothetical protein
VSNQPRTHLRDYGAGAVDADHAFAAVKAAIRRIAVAAATRTICGVAKGTTTDEVALNV